MSGQWTEADLDLAALLRAHASGDTAGAAAILDGVGPDGVRAIALALAGAFTRMALHYVAASQLIEDDAARDWLTTMPEGMLEADPELRAALLRVIEGVQRQALGDSAGG